jgi:hypothetical protein
MSVALLDRRGQGFLHGITWPEVASMERERGSDVVAKRSALKMEARGARTLDELVRAAWDGLTACEPVCCPVCRGRMVVRAASSSGEAESGSCTDCGASLS